MAARELKPFDRGAYNAISFVSGPARVRRTGVAACLVPILTAHLNPSFSTDHQASHHHGDQQQAENDISMCPGKPQMSPV